MFPNVVYHILYALEHKKHKWRKMSFQDSFGPLAVWHLLEAFQSNKLNDAFLESTESWKSQDLSLSEIDSNRQSKRFYAQLKAALSSRTREETNRGESLNAVACEHPSVAKSLIAVPPHPGVTAKLQYTFIKSKRRVLFHFTFIFKR